MDNEHQPDEALAMAGIATAVIAAYELGWRRCAKWAQRQDLIAYIGSPAYEADRDKSLKAATENKQ